MGSQIQTVPGTETRFRAMGTTVEIVILGGPRDLAARAQTAIDDLEGRWTRFRASSELCRLNAAAGTPVAISRPTFDAVARAVEGWKVTGGRFDPTVLRALEATGYDRDFASVPRTGPALRVAREPAPGCDAIELDPTVRSIRLPPGVRLDLGGIGRGLAADFVAEALLDAGADGVLVRVGRAARVAGQSPCDEGWLLELDNPLAFGSLAPVRLAAGAVCTSTRTRHKWTRGGMPLHDLIDRATGTPSWSGLASVTVLAAQAWEAEVLAKAAFVAGPRTGPSLLISNGVTGLVVRDDGRVDELGGLAAFR